MDDHRQELARLCDKAIQETEKWRQEALQRNTTWAIRDSAVLLDHLKAIRERALDGSLPPHRRAGLSVGRAVSEWLEGGPVFEAVWEIERYYASHF